MEIPKKDYNNIVGLAKKYALRSFDYIDVNDLIQEGCVAYIKGLAKYDEAKNDYYMGFIYKRVVGAMLDFIASQSIHGASTVRNIEPATQISTTSIDLVQEAISHDNEEELLEQVDTERLFNKFVGYLEDMTELEKAILVGYFVDRKSMVKLGEELKISRLKIKRIINACISYIKRKYTYDVATKVNFKVLSRI
jgi:RNA polymerase sigma factor (sigma-70 family)